MFFHEKMCIVKDTLHVLQRQRYADSYNDIPINNPLIFESVFILEKKYQILVPDLESFYCKFTRSKNTISQGSQKCFVISDHFSLNKL